MIIKIVISVFSIFIAILWHELAHGWVALKLGDDTAKNAGRLSLNPVKHIDVFGTLILPILLLLSKSGFVFGWAKPIPIDYRKLKNYKRDIVLVSAAGIIANILLAIISAILLKITLILPVYAIKGVLSMFWLYMIIFNTVLAMFNLLPIPPLDGSKILLGWSQNPLIIRFLNADRLGLIFIVTFAFILPALLQHFGIDFNPLTSYLRATTLFITSGLI